MPDLERAKGIVRTSRIASPDASLSLSAIVFASTKRAISADVNSALHPETSIHLKMCAPFPTMVSAFLRAQSRQNKCPSAHAVMQFSGHSSKQQPLLSTCFSTVESYHSNSPPFTSCSRKLSNLAASSSSSSCLFLLSSSFFNAIPSNQVSRN